MFGEEVAVGWELEQVDSSVACGHCCFLCFDLAVLLSKVAPFRIGDGGKRRSWDGQSTHVFLSRWFQGFSRSCGYCLRVNGDTRDLVVNIVIIVDTSAKTRIVDVNKYANAVRVVYCCCVKVPQFVDRADSPCFHLDRESDE